MDYGQLTRQLTADLQDAGRKNMSPPSGMGDSEARDWSMGNVAEAIAKAIRSGMSFQVKGEATVGQLNATRDKSDGDIWAVTDSGTLLNQRPPHLAVTAGDLVMWVDNGWTRFLHIDLSGYATIEQLGQAVGSLLAGIAQEATAREAGDAGNARAIEAHAGRTDNPHGVTAHQVDAYTRQETDDANAEIITSLEDETTARRVNDELLQQQIEEVAVQTDWNQDDAMALDYLKNKPTTITTAEIEALFI